MKRPSKKRSSNAVCIVLVALGLTRGIGCGGSDIHDAVNFREDVILCESAVAHIETCCPNLKAPADACVFFHDRKTTLCGCDSATNEVQVTPVLAIARSEELLDTACDVLAEGTSCDRLESELRTSNRAQRSERCN